MKKRSPEILRDCVVTDIADQGMGMLRHEGKVIFVEQAVPGDVADVILRKNKKDYALGSLHTLKEPSSLRTEAFCSHFGTCGGCTWQNVAYTTQLTFKHRLVEEAFRRIGALQMPELPPVLPAPHEKYYRNKLEFTFSDQAWIEDADFDAGMQHAVKPALGFHVRKRFAHVFDMQHCYLQPYPSNEIRKAVRSYALMHGLPFYNLREHSGFLRHMILRTNGEGKVMLILSVAMDNKKWVFPLLDHVAATFPEVISLYYVVNNKVNDYLYDLDIQFYMGEERLVETLDHVQYHLGPKSFFQTNTEQAGNLYRLALEMAELRSSDSLFDLYTGLGSIALLAASLCRQVTGIELVEEAVTDAKLNAAKNNISNCNFICGDMSKMFTPEFIASYPYPRVVITDPPRAGMTESICRSLVSLAPERIVYISCNPVTQARDIRWLSGNYRVTRMQPVDMFPQTWHVENIALLEKYC